MNTDCVSNRMSKLKKQLAEGIPPTCETAGVSPWSFIGNIMRRHILDLIVILSVGVLTLAVLTIGINKPLNGHHDYNNRFFSQVARNYLKYDLSVTRLGQLISYDTKTFTKEYYTHHPILLPLTLSGSIFIFGYSPWSVRLVPIIFSIGTLIFFYLLLRRFFSIPIALISLGYWIVSPMFLYFGKMADHESPTLFFVTLSIYAYVLYYQTKIKRYWRLCFLTVFVAQYFGWPGYYLAAILFVVDRNWLFLIISSFNFAIFLFHTWVLTGSLIGGGLWDILLFRMGLRPLSWVREDYTMVQLAKQEISWSFHFFNPVFFFFTCASSLYIFVKTLFERKFTLQFKVWFIFLFVAFVHVFLFKTGAWRHDYWLYYFLPVYSISTAIGATVIISLKKGRVWKIIVVSSLILLVILAWWQGQPFFWALQTMISNEAP